VALSRLFFAAERFAGLLARAVRCINEIPGLDHAYFRVNIFEITFRIKYT